MSASALLGDAPGLVLLGVGKVVRWQGRGDFGSVGIEGERNIHEGGALAVFVDEFQLIVAGLNIEEHVTLGGLTRADMALGTEPLGNAIAIAQFRVGAVGIVDKRENRHDGFGAAVVIGRNAHQEEAILRYPRFEPGPELRLPLPLENSIGDVPQRDALAHLIRARRIGFFRGRAGKKNGEKNNGKQRTKERKAVQALILALIASYCQ